MGLKEKGMNGTGRKRRRKEGRRAVII